MQLHVVSCSSRVNWPVSSGNSRQDCITASDSSATFSWGFSLEMFLFKRSHAFWIGFISGILILSAETRRRGGPSNENLVARHSTQTRYLLLHVWTWRYRNLLWCVLLAPQKLDFYSALHIILWIKGLFMTQWKAVKFCVLSILIPVIAFHYHATCNNEMIQ